MHNQRAFQVTRVSAMHFTDTSDHRLIYLTLECCASGGLTTVRPTVHKMRLPPLQYPQIPTLADEN